MRGEKLRHHILWTAKDVFLAEGFERAGMETIANRAGTTKRTLYAHFANKEALFLAVVELVQELFTGKLGEPGDYADEPVEALTRFCGQFRRTMLWGPSIRTVRLGIAEAERFPLGAANLYRVLLGSAGDAIARFLGERANLLPDEARIVQTGSCASRWNRTSPERCSEHPPSRRNGRRTTPPIARWSRPVCERSWSGAFDLPSVR